MYAEDLKCLCGLNAQVNVWNYEWIRDDRDGFLARFSYVNYGTREIAINAPKRKVSSNSILDIIEAYFHRNSMDLLGKLVSRFSDRISVKKPKLIKGHYLDTYLDDTFNRDGLLLSTMYLEGTISFHGFELDVLKRWYPREYS